MIIIEDDRLQKAKETDLVKEKKERTFNDIVATFKEHITTGRIGNRKGMTEVELNSAVGTLENNKWLWQTVKPKKTLSTMAEELIKLRDELFTTNTSMAKKMRKITEKNIIDNFETRKMVACNVTAALIYENRKK